MFSRLIQLPKDHSFFLFGPRGVGKTTLLRETLPKEITITSKDVKKAISKSVKVLVDSVREIVEETPPELLTDIVERGIFLAGGGALIRGLDKKIAEETKLPVYITDDPLTAVVRGCGQVLENLDLLYKVKVTGGLR